MLYYIWFEVPNGNVSEHVGVVLEAENADAAVKQVIDVAVGEWECGKLDIHHIEPVLGGHLQKWYEENQANGRLWL